jgi:hypothetical protein
MYNLMSQKVGILQMGLRNDYFVPTSLKHNRLDCINILNSYTFGEYSNKFKDYQKNFY